MPTIPYDEHVRIVREYRRRIFELEQENEALKQSLQDDFDQFRIDELADFAEDNGKEILSEYLIVSIEEH